MLIVLFAAAVVLLGPVLGCSIPLANLLRGEGVTLFRLRVLTCNVDGEHVHTDALRGLLDETQPDIVAMQEWPAGWNPADVLPPGWHVEKGKGLCLASRWPIRPTETVRNAAGWRDIISRYDLETPAGDLHFFNVHLETPRRGLEAVRERPWSGIADLKQNLVVRRQESETASSRVRQTDGAVLVAGDFNMPTDSGIYRDNWASFRDGFSTAGLGLGHTKFTRWFGVRIDHILASPGWRFRRCWVGPDVGSDHCPVVADLDWVAGND
jgi:vancomycin resistance protein VanJ